MKKNQIQWAFVIAGLAASSSVVAADAPPPFKFYGTAGLGVISGSGFSASNPRSVSGLADGLHSTTMFGFLGGTDLGDGVAIKYNLEGSMSFLTGAAGKDTAGFGYESTNAPLFDREANISLKDAEHGELKAGRLKNIGYEALQEFDSRGNWNFGGLKPIARYAGFYSGTQVTRFDSGLRYTSPKFEGFTFDYAHGFANKIGDANLQKSDNAGIRYANGPFEAVYSYLISGGAATPNNTPSQYASLVAAKYAVTPAIALFGGNANTRNPSYANGGTSNSAFGSTSGKVDNRTTANTYWLGAVYKHSPKWSYNAATYAVTDKVNADGRDSVTMNSIGAIYNLGKGTDINIDFVKANRSANAASVFGILDRWVPDNSSSGTNADSKVNQSAIAVSVQYKF